MGRNTRRRSRGGSEGTPASKRKKRTEWTESAFGRAVEPAGLLLSDGSGPNQLTVEPALFQKKLSALFRRHPNTQEAVDEFSDGLKKYTEDHVRFRQALQPTSVTEGADVMSRSGGLDSLMRQLLSIDHLQPSVAHLLLLRLSSFMDSSSSSHSMNTRELCQMPALILSQLRWLDHIVNGQDLCRELLEVVGVAQVEIQREIVTAIPEILDDAQHNTAAVELKSLMQSNSGLMAAVVDALSSLNLSADIEAEVLGVSMECLGTAPVADLPLLLKFIVGQVTSKNAVEIIGEVRERLDFESAFMSHPAACSTPRSSQRHTVRLSAEVSGQFMVFDAISSSIRFQKPVADGWMKSIEAVNDSSGHKVVDLFVLFILHSLPSRKKAVETLFAAKVRTQLFTEELLAAAFGPQAKALSEFFPSVLSLCEFLLSSPSPTVTSFTTSLYLHLFSTFDIYSKQEVIGTLVTHIGSGLPAEVDHALDILATLVETHRPEMDRFAVLIKGVLDYLEHLSMGQIRRLYSILSVLAFHDVEAGSGVQDEMHTLIRKQLSHVEPKYRRMGVVGSVMIIQQLGRKREAADISLRLTAASQSSSQSDSTLPPARRRQAISMLDDVLRSCSHSPDSALLFCDEMSAAVKSLPLDSALLRHLCDETTSVFQDTFLVEVSEALPSDLGLPVELAEGLDSSEEGSIAVNIFPLAVRSGEKMQERGGVLRAMAAQFRLLRICEQTLNGSLEGVDALLGAPVVMCVKDRLESEMFEDLPVAKREGVCLSLCHCLNWFREMVCAFSEESDIDMRGKVLLRLRNITELQSLLESCMTATPSFVPPLVTTEEVKTPVRHRRGKRLGSKGETSVAANTTSIATQNVDKDSTSAVEKTPSTSTISLDLYRQFFRELDLGVFAVLEYGSISRTLLDSEMHTKERDELKLLPRQLCLLLRDLSHKLSTSLSLFGSRGLKSRGRPSGGGRGSGGKIRLFSVDQLVSMVASLMSSLCEHLESTSGFFQAQLEENDGVEDMHCSHEDYPIHCTNLDLLLRAMATFFAWPPLRDPHYSEQLYTALQTLSSRMGQTSSQQSSSIPELAELSHRYLQQFSDSLPSLSSAHQLAKLMVAIGKTTLILHPPISETCRGLLQRKWVCVGASNQQRNEGLEYLLKYHVEWSEDPLVVLETIAGEGVTDLLGEDAAEESSLYPTLSGATLPSYYRAMMTGLVTQIKAIPPPNKKTTPTTEEYLERFHALEVSAKVLYILINIVKSFDRRALLSSALKYGRLYVEHFIKSGMPVLHHLFRSRKDDVMTVLKTLQQSTRLLQHFCGHSKVSKDIALTNHVPPCKRSLETLVFAVKELLTAQNCAEAFWVGNLKNRDIRGQEILSQSSQANTTHRDEEEEGDGEGTEDGSSTTTVSRREEILDSESEERED